MKKLNNKITKIFLSFFIVFFILNNLLITSKADVASDLDVDVNKYTDSDSLLNTSKYTICNYPSLINSDDRGGITFTNKYDFKNIGIDDYIVEIVPKEYFSLEGNHYYIGQEYGFFIHTEDRKIDFKPEVGIVYNSTVLVFDIITETDVIKTKNTLKATVEPIFQYKYICMKGGAFFSIHGNKFDFEVDEPWVIADPSYMSLFDKKIKYEMCNEYCIKDVSFGANLFNEDELNRGAENYNALEDKGMFFTGYDYSYKGFESASDDEIKAFIDTAYFVYGTLSDSKASDAIGKIIEIKNLTDDYKSLVSDYLPTIGSIEHKDKNITAVFDYNNRTDQLKEHKDSEGKPFLVKTAAVFVKSVNGVELKLGINDSAQAVFRVNYEKELNGKINYTRFTNQIVLSVAKSRSGDTVSCFDGIVTKFVGEPNKKELEYDKIETISLLPYGKNHFVFKPEYSGNYEFDIVLPEDSIIYFNDEKYYYSNSKITKFLHFGEQVNIEIVNTKITQLGSIIVKLSNNISNEKLYQDEKLLICLGDIEGVKRISTGNSNVVIEEIKYSFNNKLISYICNNEKIEECSILSYPFKNNLKYFVVLKNNSKQELSINEPKIEDVDEICIDNGNEIPVFNNYTYYKFETKNASKYVFSFDKNCDYIIIDNNLNEKINYLHKLNNAFAINLGNNIYYIGIKSDSYSKINFKVSLFENAYKWKITENNKEYYPKEDEINLEIDKVYNFYLMTNDVDVDIYYNSTTINSQITKNISEEGELKIPSDVRIDESITVTAMDRSTNKAICTISVKPQLNLDKVNVSSFNDEGLGFNMAFPKYVHFVRYELGFGSEKLDLIAFNSDPEKVESLNKDILDDYKNLNLISYNGEIIINIYEIGALDRNKNDKTYKCNFSLKLNNLFYSGTGTSNDPYIISSKRHFKNIKYTASNSYYYKLNNDIDISEYHDSFGMTEFRGVLDGNEHEIIGFEHIIDLGQLSGPSFETNFGLFRVNYGTIKNLTLVNFGIKTDSDSIGNANRIVNIGIVCGINYGRIENCKCKPNGKGVYFNCVEANAGGIAGTNGGTIIDCFVNYLTIDSIGNSGLIVGHNNAYGVISKCTGDGRIICHYKEANQEKQYSVGGIVGTNQGKINYCKNYGIVSFYLDTPCDSRILQPRMGMIIGTNYKNGSYEGCQSFNEVDKTGLKTVSWTEGWLWNKKTYEHNQAYYCGSMCGQDYR